MTLLKIKTRFSLMSVIIIKNNRLVTPYIFLWCFKLFCGSLSRVIWDNIVHVCFGWYIDWLWVNEMTGVFQLYSVREQVHKQINLTGKMVTFGSACGRKFRSPQQIYGIWSWNLPCKGPQATTPNSRYLRSMPFSIYEAYICVPYYDDTPFGGIAFRSGKTMSIPMHRC